MDIGLQHCRPCPRIAARIGTVLGTCAIAVCAGPAAAQHDGDIFVTTQAGKLVTGTIELSGSLTVPFRAFTGVFGEAPNFTNDPGFDTAPGTFTPGTQIGFTIGRALRVWDGADFKSIPVERLRIALGLLGPVFTPLDDTPVPGFGMLVNEFGEFHHHPGVTLQAPAGDGVYLYEAFLWTSDPGLVDSDPFWIVFRQRSSAAAQADALLWVERFRSNPCRADLNLDTEVDFSDLELFISFYNAGNSGVDFNGDTEIDFSDIEAFISIFNSPC